MHKKSILRKVINPPGKRPPANTQKRDPIKKKRLRRRNFFPTFVAIVLSWVVLIGIVFFIEPTVFGAIALFFLAFFVAILLTFSTILASTRRGIIISISALLFLALRYFGVGNIVNFLLIVGLAATVDFYFSKNS